MDLCAKNGKMTMPHKMPNRGERAKKNKKIKPKPKPVKKGY